jgi:hypothetical protein
MALEPNFYVNKILSKIIGVNLEAKKCIHEILVTGNQSSRTWSILVMDYHKFTSGVYSRPLAVIYTVTAAYCASDVAYNLHL